MSCVPKIVVFDLDETLGYFMELGMFWDALNSYIKYKQIQIPNNQVLFNNLLDLYPEFLRSNIIDILKYIKRKKTANHCSKIMIYTNNQGPVEWAKHIMSYFENKLEYKIFDQIIAAFKVRGKHVELCRTTHLKTHADFVKCTKIPSNTHICFLDDVYYPDMTNGKIYYINVKPYVYDLEIDAMVDRFMETNIIGTIDDKSQFKEYMTTFLNKYNYIYTPKSKESQNIDVIVSKQILVHLRTFFKTSPIGLNRTKKQKNYYNKTIKRKTF